MNVHITSRQEPLSPEQRDFCAKRLKALAKIMSFATDTDVIVGRERNRFKVEIHVQAKGGGLVVVEESPALEGSLRRAFDSLEKKLKKEREKFREKKRRGGRARKTLALPAEAVPAEEAPRRIIRSELFVDKPQTVEEAVLHFEYRKKEVLMFRSQETDKWAVLFRRKDGHIGLVEPE